MARLWAKLKGFFTHFIVVSSRFILDFTHFIAISSHLIVIFSYFIAVLSRIFVAFSHLFIITFRFIIVLTHLFACKRHFLGHYAFLKFLNALFLGFLRLSLLAVFTKTARQAINLALFLLFGLSRKALALLAMTAHFVILGLLQKGKKSKDLKAHLPFLDTSLSLSMTKRVFGMTNSGFCLKMTDKKNALCHLATIDKSHNFAHQKHFLTQSLGTKFTIFTRFYGLPRSLCSLAMTARHKFKFFTQNLTHLMPIKDCK